MGCLKQIPILVGLILLLPSASANDIVMPVNGKCADDYMAFDGLCLLMSTIGRLPPEEAILKINEFKTTHRMTSAREGTQTICSTEVREKDGDFFKLANGAVAEKTSYGYLGYIGYGTEALLIYSGTLGSIMVEDELVEVELIRPPTYCDSPSTYIVEAVTSDRAIINDEIFEIWGYCSRLSVGDRVVFSNSSAAWGGCINTDIYNLSSGGSACTLYCQ